MPAHLELRAQGIKERGHTVQRWPGYIARPALRRPEQQNQSSQYSLDYFLASPLFSHSIIFSVSKRLEGEELWKLEEKLVNGDGKTEWH